MNEDAQREEIVRFARSLFERGFSVGTAGNISVRREDGILITPTNSCMGFLEAARISKLDPKGQHVAGDPPSKELFLHRAFYATRPQAKAVVHLHSTYATALSCCTDLDPEDTIPAVTPYMVMRVGKVPLIDYAPPGDPALGHTLEKFDGQKAAVLLGNHGPIVSGSSLSAAVYAAEELEETAKLAFLLRGSNHRRLSDADFAELKSRFGTLG